MANYNAEKLVIAWLINNISDGWLVQGDMPKSNPEKFALVDRTGGPRESMVLDRAEILIEFYHKSSRLVASDEALRIADLVPDMLETESITHVKVNSLVKLDDTIKQYYRYQLYLDVSVRRYEHTPTGASNLYGTAIYGEAVYG